MIEQQARVWNIENPNGSVSSFACRYPGQYREAADALRKVRRQVITPENQEDRLVKNRQPNVLEKIDDSDLI